MLYVNGEWVNSDKSFNVNSPVTGKTIGTVPIADEGIVKAAIDSGESAKEKWRWTPFRPRATRNCALLPFKKQAVSSQCAHEHFSMVAGCMRPDAVTRRPRPSIPALSKIPEILKQR